MLRTSALASALLFATVTVAQGEAAQAPTAPTTESPAAAPVATSPPGDASAPVVLPPATETQPAATDAQPSPAIELPEIDGWRVVSYTSEPRPLVGEPQAPGCGFARDVLVMRSEPPPPNTEELPAPGPTAAPEAPANPESGEVPPAAAPAPSPAVTEMPATLVVRCQKDEAANALAPAPPVLEFSTAQVAEAAPVAADKPVEDKKPPVCGSGERPKSKEQLKADEVSCVELEPRPCAMEETPKTPEQLVPGELACVKVASDRGSAFFKGELTHFGDVQLVNARSSFGVGFGATVLDNVVYGVLRPDLNLRFGKFSLGLGTPLRFEFADFNGLNPLDPNSFANVFGEVGRFRTEDWDQLEDVVRPLRYLTWGRKEDKLYVDFSRVHALTLGHGQLVRRYNPNVDIDEDNIFAAVDGYGDWGGVELMAGPFPLPRIIGGLAFVKPLAFLTDERLRSLSIGLSYVAELNSPTTLDGDFSALDQRFRLAVDPQNQLVWRNKGNAIGDVVQGIGLDTEIKVLKNDNIDIKVYGDYSHLFFPGDSSGSFQAFSGGGLALGGLMRANLGQQPARPAEQEDEDTRLGKKPREMKPVHAFRVRLEARTFAPTYLPSYFNTLYEVDRFQFGQLNANGITERALLPTKIAFLASKQLEPWRGGIYAEASYAWIDAVGATLTYEDAVPFGSGELVTNMRNLGVHLETQGLGWLQLFASYHFRNFNSLDGLLSFSSDNEVFYFGGRLQVLPIMFINIAAQRGFRLGFDTADHPDQPDAQGLRYSSRGLHNVWAGGFDVELGWQF